MDPPIAGMAVNPVSSRVVPIARASEAWESVKAGGQFVAVGRDDIADAEVVALPGGGYRIYAGAMADHSIVSFASRDGVTWAQERGVRVRNAAFPDVVVLPNGEMRMYFQREQVIQSALSRDGGLTFADERGVRVPKGLFGADDRDNVGASTTVLMRDGTWRMYYRGTRADAAFFNGGKMVILSAVSRDGLTWTREAGVRVDPGDLADAGVPATQRTIDGPNAHVLPDGRIKLYFWVVGGCQGICMATSADGLTFGGVEQVMAIEDTPAGQQPGDPAVLEMPNGEAYLYYGGRGPGGTGAQGIWVAKKVR